MTYYYLAFFMGLFGSVHCAVMCGPLILATQGGQQLSWFQVMNKLLYQVGRILTYAVLGTIFGSAQFMLLFGLGTLPLMIVFSLASSFSMNIVKVKFAKILPLLFLIMGIWFILRGANLNIPYLSPLLHLNGAMHCA